MLSFTYTSNLLGLMPRITFTFLPPTINSTSTIEELPLTELTSCDFEMLRNGLLNRPKQSASRMVDFPAPFSPMIKVVGLLSNCISVKLLPVERKFFQRTYLKVITVLNHSLLHITISSY